MFLKLIFLITLINKLVNCGKNKNLIINQNTIDKDLDAIAIIFNLDLNNTSDEELNLEVRDGKCCLKNVGEVDCNMLELVGCSDILPGGTSKTIKLISPILEPFQRKGYCTAHIDTWGNDKRKMRDIVKFNFDIKDDELNRPIIKCDNTDEDPINNCKPVNCDVHYNGHKPLYDRITKKCVKAINCTDDSKILNPYINNCVDNTVKERDIEFIKSNMNRKPKDILIISNNIMKNNSRYTNDIDDMRKTRIKQNRASLNNLKAYLNCNRYMFSILGLVILVQCILICTMLYYVTKNCDCYKKKIVERKYFNYRQDASVTTPLIGTSNIDTETIDYQYMSDSSNVDNKIKCYKACQKEKNNDVRVSLSDDILSKCINRRNWTQHRSETIPESKEDNYAKVFTPKSIKENKDSKINIDNINHTKSNTHNIGAEESIVKTENNSNVIDNEVTKSQSFSKIENKPVELTSKSGSEREIKCHSYSSNMTGFKPSVHSKTLGLFKTVKGASVSTEKSAQASFSNDSIDDFLSERGVVYLAGENLSKYSFSSSNPVKTSNTSMSSRTSKNNVVKNVLSLLRRKSKVTSSDPILKKSKQNIDLELLHMSRASMFSSSNDSDKGFKRLKDSRTSL